MIFELSCKNYLIMKNKIVVTLFLSFFLFSCTKDDIRINPDNPLIGIWNYSHYEVNASIYNRSQDFEETEGYRFNSDGSLLIRANSGDCATPPISYANYKGSWSIINDTLIQINTKNWSGSIAYRLDIEQIDSSYLKIIRVSTVK
jgi:hypothetical protein